MQKKLPGDKFAKWKVFWEIQQVLYLSIEYKESEEHFIERAKNAMNKFLKSMTYPPSRNILKNTMPRYMVSYYSIFIFTSCICV